MRVLVFHGYLLGGTGSNVYNARLAEALRGLGHEVHLLCQDRHPARHPFVDAVGDWDEGALQVRELERAPPAGGGSCTVYRPDIGGLLPVYVADRYEGVQALTFLQASDEQLERYVQANVAAARELCELLGPHLALANHLVMGPLIFARALRGDVPYAVKIHGSALEYTVKPAGGRFLAAAREGLAGARCILVGSRHTAESLWDALGDDSLAARTRLGPPGVDVQRFAPRARADAFAALRLLAAELAGGSSPQEGASSAFARDAGAAGRELERIEPQRDRPVAFVGKLIVSKGIDLLLAAWPLVLWREAAALLLVVGFGAYRAGAEQLVFALGAGDLEAVRELALRGRALEQGSAKAQPLSHLLAFLERLDADPVTRQAYLRAAQALPQRVLFLGRLEHEELAGLLPACEALVVPSTFPESFGMVAAEAAACGVLPVGASHSGLAEVARELARDVPHEAGAWLSFPVDDRAVLAIAERLLAWLAAEERLRARTREGLVAVARARWSWQGVAHSVIAAAQGRLQELPPP